MAKKTTKADATKLVKAILKEELARANKVHKFFVIHEIKNRIHPTELLNKALEDPSWSSTDGIKNMHHGAKRIYREALRNLCRYFTVDKEGWIRPRHPDAPA
jgi:hypothetical protein